MGIFITAFYVVNLTLFFKSFARNNKAFKFFNIYLLLIAIVQILTIYIGQILHKPNLFLSHFYFIFQFIFLSLFYFELLQLKLVKTFLFAVMALLVFQYFEHPELFFKYNALGMSLTQMILVFYSILYFYKSLSGKGEFVIVNIGIFFYLLSSTLIFASGNLVLNLDISEATQFTLINVNRILILVFQILIFIEWYRNYRIKSIVNG